MIVKPSTARQKSTFVSELQSDTFKIIATGPVELVSAIVTGGGAAAVFRLLDLPNGGGFVPGQPVPSYNLKDGMAIGARSSESQEYTPAQPAPFKKGLILVCEQGEGSNAEITVTLNGN